MSHTTHAEIIENPELHDQRGVFADRREAGEALAELMQPYRDTQALVLGIPAGGVPVAAMLAERMDWPLDVAVVSKITLPWNTEVGFGAVAFDGTVEINGHMVDRVNVSREEIESETAVTRDKVSQRLELFRGDRPLPDLSGRVSVLVDDGLASGFTLRVAATALRNCGAEEIWIAVPTAHAESIMAVRTLAEKVFCPNVREGYPYAVADAYRNWCDIDPEEAMEPLRKHRGE
jgi:predicted phosphoribosyltransferase